MRPFIGGDKQWCVILATWCVTEWDTRRCRISSLETASAPSGGEPLQGAPRRASARCCSPLAARAALLDDFEDRSAWSTGASEGVSVEIAQDEGQRGMAMRLDFDFKGHAGYLVARKQVAWPLPDDYAFTFYIRGDAPENNLEIKFNDASGQNVWWSSQRHFEFSPRWRKLTIKKRHIEFAWGPNPGELKEVAYVEFAIAAGRGGEGSVWIDQLSFAERDLGPYDLTPELKASTSTEGSSTAAVLDDDPASAWHSGAVSEEQWLLIDFKKLREYGGLVIDWADEDFATTYEIQVSTTSANGRAPFASRPATAAATTSTCPRPSRAICGST